MLYPQLVLSFLLVSLSAPAAAQDIDRIVFGLETRAHLPSTTPRINESSDALSLSELRPVVDELGLLWGASINEISSEVLLRVGFGFASGDWPQGSSLRNASIESYSFQRVPLSVGWRATLLPYSLRLLMGVDLGGSVGHLRFEGATQVESGWQWMWAVRGRLGAHIDILDWLGARIFVEGSLSEKLLVEHGPNLDPSGLGIGLALVATTQRSALESAPKDSEYGLRRYESVGNNRLDEAFALIREADGKVKQHDYLDAERAYREALELLPRDPETLRNVRAPVLVDWANTLAESGRTQDAINALNEALEIAPNFERARVERDRIERER